MTTWQAPSSARRPSSTPRRALTREATEIARDAVRLSEEGVVERGRFKAAARRAERDKLLMKRERQSPKTEP